jgi:hypothetical protein
MQVYIEISIEPKASKDRLPERKKNCGFGNIGQPILFYIHTLQ